MEKRIDLPGSTRRAVAGAKVVGKVDPKQRIEITIQVRRRSEVELQKKVKELATQQPSERRYMTRTELATLAGADPADIPKIDAFAHENKLSVTEVSIPRRTVKLSGTIADMSAAFGVKLQRYKAGSVTYRGRTGTVKIPASLGGIIERVLGLDDRPTTRPHYRVGITAKGRSARGSKKKAVHPQPASYSPPAVGAIYSFPAGLDGTGQTIALIELNDVNSDGAATGAGYTTSDLNTFFKNLKLATPTVTPVGVDGGANVPGKDANADAEVTLDIEVAGSIAPGASIAVYFGTNTDDGFIQAVTAAVHDDVRKPSIISISWGQAEETATSQMLQGLDQALEEAAAIGVTVCVAAGDNGSADEQQAQWDHKPHVDFPASSSYALACGGTTLAASSAPNSPVEKVWNEGSAGGATGGGVSNFFAKPSYQANSNVPAPAASAGGRGVPDVSGNADPYSGYAVFVGGKSQNIGGTSAVAPLWAGLLARINQKVGKPVGFINALIYAPGAASAFHDVTQGNNDIYNDLKGKFPAGMGWDPCTGQGTPDGTAVLAVLSGQAGSPSHKRSRSAGAA
jgi:kumamolisin